jgi:hypothetical protein
MMARNPHRKEPKECPVQLALGALEGHPNVMDLPMRGFDPSPTVLGLDDGYESEMRSTPRGTGPAVDVCSKCGRRARDGGQWGVLA